jgi:hypothetical protein
VLSRVDAEMLAARHLEEDRRRDQVEPYLREVEGEVYDREYWDATPGLEVMRKVVSGAFLPPCFRLISVGA